MLPLAPIFFFHDTPPPELYTLSLHDALPICSRDRLARGEHGVAHALLVVGVVDRADVEQPEPEGNGRIRRELDRKSTRLNSSHLGISYAVFCLKKKK